MKLPIILILLIISVNNLFSQTNFVWEKTDSVSKSKSQIYTDTKMFIAETWKSSKAVIENDDKEGGIILIKGNVIKSDTYSMNVLEYVYAYTITFRMKDSKYKITLDNVYCKSTSNNFNWQVKKVEPFDGDNCPKINTGLTSTGLPKKKMIALMASVKNELQSIIDNYTQYIKSPSKNSDW